MKILLTVLVGYFGYIVAKKLMMPAPGMVGSMIAVGIFNVTIGHAYLPVEIKLITQAISGAFIGVQVYKEDVMQIRKLIKPILLLIVMLTVNTFIVGIVISLITNIDVVTALLSCVSGGVTDMALISLDMNADSSVVALLQLVRLVGTLLFFPTWIQWISRNNDEQIEMMNTCDQKINSGSKLNRSLNKYIKVKCEKLIFTLLITILAGLVGLIMNFPSGILVCSMVVVAFFNSTTTKTYMPNKIRIAAQILAGSLVGCSVTRDTVLGLKDLVIPAVLLLISYLVVNLFYGVICKKLKLLDFKSALFASSPAGVSDMALIAGDLGADMKKTSIIQVARLVYAIGIMPILIQLFIDYI